MTRKPETNEFSEEESRKRFEKALRGGLNTPAQPLKSVPPKRPKTQGKASKKG